MKTFHWEGTQNTKTLSNTDHISGINDKWSGLCNTSHLSHTNLISTNCKLNFPLSTTANSNCLPLHLAQHQSAVFNFGFWTNFWVEHQVGEVGQFLFGVSEISFPWAFQQYVTRLYLTLVPADVISEVIIISFTFILLISQWTQFSCCSYLNLISNISLTSQFSGSKVFDIPFHKLTTIN